MEEEITNGEASVSEESVVETVEESETSSPEEEIDQTEESEEVEEEVKEDKKKLNAQERIQQLIDQRNKDRELFESKVNELEAKFKTLNQPQQSDYIEVTPEVESRINQILYDLDVKRAQAELDGNYLKAVEYKKQIDDVVTKLHENEQKRESALVAQQQAAISERLVADINQRAELYRQSYNIPNDVWVESNKWFAEQCQNNAVLGTKFREIAERQGPMAAVEFASWFVQENRLKPAQEQLKEREQSKAKSIAGGSAGRPASEDLRDDLSIEEWMKRRIKK